MSDEMLAALQTEEGLEVAPGVRVRSLADYRGEQNYKLEVMVEISGQWLK